MNMKFAAVCLATVLTATTNSCGMSPSGVDKENTIKVGNKLAENQPTPTDIEYSLERYNLTRRAYWVNGMTEKADSLYCPVAKPLGYIVLIAEGVGVVGSYVVDGKVSSLNSYLTPDSEAYASETYSRWIPDVDGSYGENDNGIFFFTADGHYKEWNGLYLYSDTPMHIDDPIISVSVEE